MSDSMNRRKFIQAGALGVCALARGGQLAAATIKKQPNVLIITTDQQTVSALSAYGNKWLKTPHMDSIAASGVFFTKSYCPYPVCSPSRASLLTGRPAHEIGVNANSFPIDSAVPNLGQHFREAGYATAFAGKWHLPEVAPASGGIPGFEYLTPDGNKVAITEFGKVTADKAVEFLGRKHDRPFLLYVSLNNPHDICLWHAPNEKFTREQLWSIYCAGSQAPLPPAVANPAPPHDEATFPANSRVGMPPNDEDWRKYRFIYYRMTEAADREVGRVLAALRQGGLEEDTIVVFTSDHGEGLGAHGRVGKMMFYEEEAAVPLIVSWKGVTPAGRLDRAHLVSGLDVLPTICDYAGVKAPAAARGMSLRPVIEHPEQAGSECVVTEMANGTARSFMVRTRRHKYMVFPRGEKTEMLFDMEADPLELKNLAGEAALAGELERHRKLLAQWRAHTEESKHPLTPEAMVNAQQKRKAGRQQQTGKKKGQKKKAGTQNL